MEFFHPALKGSEALLAQRKINAVVHAIAREDQIWFGFLQGSREAFVQIRPGKLSTRVAGFCQARDGLAGQTKIDHSPSLFRITRDEEPFKIIDIKARLR